MLSNRPSGEIFRLLTSLPLSTSLFQLYARELDADGVGGGQKKVLRDFYYVDDRRWEMACLELDESHEREFGEKVEKVRRAGKCFAEDKQFGFEAKVRITLSDSPIRSIS
jgi:hypothetical protein